MSASTTPAVPIIGDAARAADASVANNNNNTGNSSGGNEASANAGTAADDGEYVEPEWDEADADKMEIITAVPAIRARLRLIEPFRLQRRGIDWAAACLAHAAPSCCSCLPAALGFADEAVHSEYVRFLYRDLSSFIVAFIFAGAFLYPPTHVLRFTTVYTTVVAYVTGGLNAALTGIDLQLYLHVATCTRQSRIRRFLAIAAVLVASLSVSFTMYTVHWSCHHDGGVLEITRAISPGLPNVTAARRQRYCDDIIDKFRVTALTAGLGCARLQFAAAAPLIVLHVVLSEAGRHFAQPAPRADDEQPGEVAVKALLLVVIACVVAAVVYLRERLFMRMFEACVELEGEQRRLGLVNASAPVASSSGAADDGSNGVVIVGQQQHQPQQLQVELVGVDHITPANERLRAAAAAVEARCSVRKHNWIFPDLADEAAEAEFARFARQQTSATRVACFAGAAVFVIFVLAGVGIQHGTMNTPLPATPAVLFSLALVCALGGVAVVAYEARAIATATDAGGDAGSDCGPLSCALLFVTAIFTMFAAGTLPDAVVGNDVTYIFVVFNMLIAFGVADVGVCTRLVCTIVGLMIPTGYLVIATVYVSSNLVFLAVSTLLVYWQVVVLEKLLRRQFVDTKVAQFLRAETKM